ncbi:DUF3035 domain-containing protein [Parasphingopyxis algicola]|uniref:DUF3035 domain-containing protein n=1 Tax=Parasphingopyxis algicola TaxID=2026624 RepID=UPI00159FC330|nr:DUF3035 domain-containing protein [Parasphingopyxis algicola]QLC26591.1 DUF3035 domain-containing protein [Parasphingopyxis algicola]
MRKVMVVTGLVAMGASLSACSIFGGDRDRPDEFLVSRSAPLVIPPDFALTPPRPGEPAARGADSSTQALQAMFGGPAPRSAAEEALVNQADPESARPGIRSNVGDPETQAVDYGSTTRDILNAPEGDAPEATVSTPQ